MIAASDVPIQMNNVNGRVRIGNDAKTSLRSLLKNKADLCYNLIAKRYTYSGSRFTPLRIKNM